MNGEDRKAARAHLVMANFAVHSGDADTALLNAEAACALIRLHCLKPPSLFSDLTQPECNPPEPDNGASDI